MAVRNILLRAETSLHLSRSGLVVKFVLAMHEPRVRFTAATIFCPIEHLQLTFCHSHLRGPTMPVNSQNSVHFDDKYMPHCYQSVVLAFKFLIASPPERHACRVELLLSFFPTEEPFRSNNMEQ